jgi:hypothetical protein
MSYIRVRITDSNYGVPHRQDRNRMKKLYMNGYPLLDSELNQRYGTRKQAQRIADKEAQTRIPKGFWTGVICETDERINISFGGMPENRV